MLIASQYFYKIMLRTTFDKNVFLEIQRYFEEAEKSQDIDRIEEILGVYDLFVKNIRDEINFEIDYLDVKKLRLEEEVERLRSKDNHANNEQ